MPRPFDLLRERLLHAGIGRGRAGRYIAELSEHLEDLLVEERRAGRSPQEAYAHALQRLGGADVLAEAMIARRELRTWSARAPVLAYVVAPAATLALAVAAWLAVLVAASVGLRQAGGGLPGWIGPLADAAQWLSNAALAVLLGWGLAASAVRQRAAALWPSLGLIALAALGAALQVETTLPLAGAPGEIDLRPDAFGLWGYTGRFALDLAAMAVAYAALSLWRTGRGAAAAGVATDA